MKAEPLQPQDRPALSEEEVERRSKSIIDEFLHINDYKVPTASQQTQRLGVERLLSPLNNPSKVPGACSVRVKTQLGLDTVCFAPTAVTPPPNHLCTLQEAVQCVEELDLGPQLHTFVRVGVESTLERSQITRDHMGQLLLQLLRQGPLPKTQFIKGSVPCLHRR